MALIAIALTGLLSAGSAQAVTTFVVNDTADTGDAILDGVCDTCTLREALQEANGLANSGGPDRIHFAIPGDGPHTFNPGSTFPTITQPVVIDGYTEATGADATPNTATIGTNAVLKIVIDGGAAGGGSVGFTIGANGGASTIRGLVIQDFRSASGSGGIAIQILNVAGAGGNVFEGNFIGTDVAGTAAVANRGGGVSMAGGAGNSDLNTVGGPALAARNLISGNFSNGVTANSDGNTVRNNLVGVGSDGSSDLGNGTTGVGAFGSAVNNTIRDNVIAFNSAEGVAVGSSLSGAGAGNEIRFNSIFANATSFSTQGIDLGRNGLTLNDTDDPDTGPNLLQNFPVITSAVHSAGGTAISATLNSNASASFEVDFFANAACDVSNHGEGQTYLGTAAATTDAGGDASGINLFVPEGLSGTTQITATATNTATKNTSEFSQCAPVSGGLPPTAGADAYAVNEDQTLTVPDGVTDLLNNDADPEGIPLGVQDEDGVAPGTQPATAPANGTLSLSPDGSLTYTPNANFNGTDSFTYRATDSAAASNPATVSIAVAAVDEDPTPPGNDPTPPGNNPTPPSNQFTIGKLTGTKLSLTVPGAGVIDVNDANAPKKKLLLKPSSTSASAAGTVNVSLKLTKTAKKTLKQQHKVKVKAAITFTPTGGTASTQDKALKVKK